MLRRRVLEKIVQVEEHAVQESATATLAGSVWIVELEF